ncbi:hypothetical protein KC571_00935 [candidate division WWE3 bacterium]|uniref:Tetratricopeptide repeat protein n=1 Tax=candidate division WWE3 bacterium TaxID=2053526 RepID=A0A955LGN4_UNCKA|nr:hypothetical protein [candidate division WWE3 bacterium]
MNENQPIVQSLDKLSSAIIAVFFFIFPLAFFVNTTEFVEYAKMVVLIITALLLLGIWGLRSVVSGRLTVTRTPFDVQIVFIVVSFILSTWFSVSINNSIYGEFNMWHWTAAEFISFAIIFYATVTTVRSKDWFKKLAVSFLASITFVALLAIGVYFNLFDKLVSIDSLSGNRVLQLFSIDGFSPAGNIFSVAYLLAFGLLLAIVLLRGVMKPEGEGRFLMTERIPLNIQKILLGGKIILLGVALLLWLGAYIPGIPSRVDMPTVLPWSDSWRIASSAIRDYPFLGTGPSTYNAAYRAYRSVQINQTDYWNFVFNRSGSEYLTWLTSMGIVGFASLVLFAIKILFTAKKSMQNGNDMQPKMQYQSDAVLKIKGPVVVGIVISVLLFAIISTNVLIMGAFFMLLSLWILAEKLDEQSNLSVQEVNLSLEFANDRLMGNVRSNTEGEKGSRPFIPLLMGVLTVIIAFVGAYYAIQDVRSNVAFAQSIQNLAQTNAQARDIYDTQRKAITLNPRRDAYRRAYANTNITVARLFAEQRGESITDTERQDIIQLVQQSIREVQIITQTLNPANALNWQVRGRIYQSLLGVARGADQWALQAYQQAILLAPNDPQLRVDLAGLYLTLAINGQQDEGTQGQAPDETAPTVPDTKAANLLRAEAVLQNAINLKSDYPNSHFNLAVVYQEANRYDLAVRELQTTVSLLSEDSPDYDQAVKLLEDLKVKADEQAEQNGGQNAQPTPTPTPTVAEATPTPTTVAEPTVTPTVAPTVTTSPTPTTAP